MVELNGMLVSAAAAQRRQFFSSLIQRASKKKAELGGGSLTLLLTLPGVPATGQRTVAQSGGLTAAPSMDAYQHLSPELKAKLAAALEAKAAESQSAAGGVAASHFWRWQRCHEECCQAEMSMCPNIWRQRCIPALRCDKVNTYDLALTRNLRCRQQPYAH
jgi:hypothetical protein